MKLPTASALAVSIVSLVLASAQDIMDAAHRGDVAGVRACLEEDADLCIAFRKPDGGWTRLVSLPAPINTPSREMCPHVTGDGKHLFFNSFRDGNADNDWVSAGILSELRAKQR